MSTERYAGERADMNLPEGKSCADCVSFKRCIAFIGPEFISDKSVTCDWAPSRFRSMHDNESESEK